MTIDQVAVEVVHAEHHGSRVPFGPRASALGFVIRGSRRVYFAGDTDIFDGMGSMGDLDVALLPVGGWGPRLGRGHMDSDRAAQATAMLHPRLVVPIHWGTLYPLGLRRILPAPLLEPGPAFARAAAVHAPDVEVRVVAPGGSIDLPSS